MKNIIACLLLLAPGMATAQTTAEAYAYVSALQPPVWIARQNTRAALGASSPILVSDSLITGPGARLHIALADGSLIKLGENSSLDLQSLRLQTSKQSEVLTGTFKLSDGTLRYSTQKRRASFKNDLTLQLGRNLSIQTAGADFWADSGTTQDRLLLLDGSVVVTPGKKPAVTMAQANTLYTASRSADALADSVAPVQETRLLLAQTELNPQRPALQSTGAYRIALAIYSDETTAQERVNKYTTLGFPVELQKPNTSGVSGYRVVLDGLATEADAKAYSDVLKDRLKILNPQVESLLP